MFNNAFDITLNVLLSTQSFFSVFLQKNCKNTYMLNEIVRWRLVSIIYRNIFQVNLGKPYRVWLHLLPFHVLYRELHQGQQLWHV